MTPQLETIVNEFIEQRTEHLKDLLSIMYHCVCSVTITSRLLSVPQVNGRNILSVDYDRTLRTEKIYDDHRKFLLKIIYDTAGHPVLWVPSSKLLPVNVSRSSSGQISALQRGPTTERLEYDGQGRLVSRGFADGKIWSYTYLEQVRMGRSLQSSAL